MLNSLKEKEETGSRKRKRKVEEPDYFINDGDPYSRDEKKQCKDKNDLPSSSSKEHDKKDKKPEVKLSVNVNFTNYKSKTNDAFKYDYDKKKQLEKERQDKERDKERKKRAAPPPGLNFAELLKVAQSKQNEAVVPKPEDLIQEKLKEKELASKKKLDRPLTAMEKEAQEEARIRKLKRSGKLPDLPIAKLKELKEKARNKDSNKTEDKVPNNNDKLPKSLLTSKISNGCEKHSSSSPKLLKEKVNQKESIKPEPAIKDRSKYFAVPASSKSNSDSLLRAKLTESKLKAVDSKKLSEPCRAKDTDQPKYKSSEKISPSSSSKYSSINKPSPTPKGRPLLPSDAKSSRKPATSNRQFPPTDVRPVTSSRQFPPPDLRPINKKPISGRLNRVDSDDSEYDSEMDDFIDDGEEELDYSSEIKKMFGYDKSKFR